MPPAIRSSSCSDPSIVSNDNIAAGLFGDIGGVDSIEAANVDLATATKGGHKLGVPID